MEKFLNKQLDKSKLFSFSKDSREANVLASSGHYGSALLRQWQIVEVVCREFVVIVRASTDSAASMKRIDKILSKQGVDAERHNLHTQLRDVLFSVARKNIELNYRFIDVKQVEEALTTMGCNYDRPSIRYLLASKIKKGEKPVNVLSSVTIRHLRNQVVHKNQIITRAQYESLGPFLHHFFTVFDQLKRQA